MNKFGVLVAALLLALVFSVDTSLAFSPKPPQYFKVILLFDESTLPEGIQIKEYPEGKSLIRYRLYNKTDKPIYIFQEKNLEKRVYEGISKIGSTYNYYGCKYDTQTNAEMGCTGQSQTEKNYLSFYNSEEGFPYILDEPLSFSKTIVNSAEAPKDQKIHLYTYYDNEPLVIDGILRYEKLNPSNSLDYKRLLLYIIGAVLFLVIMFRKKLFHR